MRTATVDRETKETKISCIVNLDDNNQFDADGITTGIGFFDHMLTALSFHSGIDININVNGDLYVDCHHSIEDVGITLGKALKQAINGGAIARYGTAYIPMDETLGFCSLDISGRPFLVFNCSFLSDKVGDFDCQMVEEFFRAFAFNAGITLHLSCLYGANDHHKVEALFKAIAHALKQAIKPIRNSQVLSTKGTL